MLVSVPVLKDIVEIAFISESPGTVKLDLDNWFDAKSALSTVLYPKSSWAASAGPA